MQRYNPKAIEPFWQEVWQKDKPYTASDKSPKPKKYVLEYFPYPSGAAMHVGHVRNYTIGDVIARHARMSGYNVLHPMGWDAFGLPAENFAIKNNISPRQAIDENTARFKKQLMQMGFSYDWSREIDSTDPTYYRWTQWFFLLLYKKGLAYQAESLQWWCPNDKTVLANEQVEDGKCWRCGHLVEKKSLKQWFFKITDYAERLLDDLDDLDWSEAIKAMQKNWIGKSQGAEIDFEIEGQNQAVKVFTTRPDTIFGATFLVLAPEHPLVLEITGAKNKKAVEKYIANAQAKTEIDRMDENRPKTGVFTGAYAINPASGQNIPVWIADYVLAGYGTGAIMAVAGHDQRDWQFASAQNLPIVNVIEPTFGQAKGDETFKRSIFAILRNPKNGKVVILDWGPRKERWGGKMLIGGGVDGDESYETAARREITEETGYKNFKLVAEADFEGHGFFFSNVKNKNMAVTGKGLLFELEDEEKSELKLDAGEKNKFKVTWQPAEAAGAMLDDGVHAAFYNYLVLNQRYTGEGQMINSGKYDGLSSEQMREKIVQDLAKAGKAKAKTNYKIRDWLISRQRYWGAPIPIIHCDKCGTLPVPEADLPVELPEVADYTPTGDGQSPLAKVGNWVEVKCPNCKGQARRETDTMDGFACSSWYFLRFADPHNNQVPFSKDLADKWLPVDDYIGGAEHAVMHLLYARFWVKVMHDEGLVDFSEPFTRLRNHGMILAPDGSKMSKSKNNTIEPDELIADGYGADTIRLMELFIGPWNQQASWSVDGVGGCYRFLQRVWNLVWEFADAKENHKTKAPNKELEISLHQTIKKVSQDLHELGFNTAIASLMEFTNQLYKLKTAGFSPDRQWQKVLENLLILLAPFAPHITEELWTVLGHKQSIHGQEWPKHDKNLVSLGEVTIALQVNGKLKGQLELAKGCTEEQALKKVLDNQKLANLLPNKNPKRVVYVADRVINLVF